MKTEEQLYETQNDVWESELEMELRQYDEAGLLLWLNGHLSCPEQILQAGVIREENNYMRDYVSDGDGRIEGVGFDQIKER